MRLFLSRLGESFGPALNEAIQPAVPIIGIIFRCLAWYRKKRPGPKPPS